MSDERALLEVVVSRGDRDNRNVGPAHVAQRTRRDAAGLAKQASHKSVEAASTLKNHQIHQQNSKGTRTFNMVGKLSDHTKVPLQVILRLTNPRRDLQIT